LRNSRYRPIGTSLDALNNQGEEFAIDPPAREENAEEVREAQETFWDLVSQLQNIQSRVLLKLQGIMMGATHRLAELKEGERQWRPDRARHPNSCTAGEVSAALKTRLVQDPRLAAPNNFLGNEFRLTTNKPQDLMAQWVARANRDMRLRFWPRGDLPKINSPVSVSAESGR
jgi:hypothetical protein